jgi:hypothetical protein
MPNGENANLCRLVTCIAAYRSRYGAWPTHVRFTPPFLANIAYVLGPQSLGHLAELMEVRSELGNWEHGISAGGKYGVVRYDQLGTQPLAGDQDAAWAWLRAAGVGSE